MRLAVVAVCSCIAFSAVPTTEVEAKRGFRMPVVIVTGSRGSAKQSDESGGDAAVEQQTAPDEAGAGADDQNGALGYILLALIAALGLGYGAWRLLRTTLSGDAGSEAEWTKAAEAVERQSGRMPAVASLGRPASPVTRPIRAAPSATRGFEPRKPVAGFGRRG